MKVYLIYAYGWDWHRVIAVRNDKESAIHSAKECGQKVAPCGCAVYEFTVNGGEGKRIYPN